MNIFGKVSASIIWEDFNHPGEEWITATNCLVMFPWSAFLWKTPVEVQVLIHLLTCKVIIHVMLRTCFLDYQVTHGTLCSPWLCDACTVTKQVAAAVWGRRADPAGIELILEQCGNRPKGVMSKRGGGGGGMGVQERLRSIVGPKGWDYAVFWQLHDDNR